MNGGTFRPERVPSGGKPIKMKRMSTLTLSTHEQKSANDDPLAGITLLQDLTRDERDSLARRCAWRRVAARTQLLDPTADGKEMLFIVEGRARVVNYASSGREIAYAEIMAGGHVGELAALDGLSRSASVIAMEPCRIASLPASVLEELLQQHPNLALTMLRHLTRIIRINDERIAELSSLGAVQRVYRELLRHAKDTDDGGCIVDPLPTQQDIAGHTGTTRETVARALSSLLKSGGANKIRRRLVIFDRGFLESLAEGDNDTI